MPVDYLPYDERTVDMQYHNLLESIYMHGEQVGTQLDEDARMLYGHQMRFDLSNGFPLITERDLSGQFLEQGMGELFAFLNGARTLDQLESFGCRYWKRWGTEAKCSKRGLDTGDLGPGSYGAAWTTFPTAEGEPFDQIQHLVEQIKEHPHLRTHLVTPFVPQYLGRGEVKQQKVVVVPCHGLFFVRVNPNTNELSMHHVQRSADVPVGLAFNFMHYALLTMMLAQVCGYKAKELVYTINDAHMYMRQQAAVEELLSREPRRFPTITLDPSVMDLKAFRIEHVRIEDYNPHPAMLIGTPV